MKLSYCLLYVLLLAVGTSCSKSSSRSPETNADNTTITSSNGYTAQDDISEFNGKATPDELSVLLNNSDLNCESGQILKFDGTNWTCQNFESESSLKIGQDSGPCTETKEGSIRYNKSFNRMETCHSVLYTGEYRWIPFNGVIDSNTTFSVVSGDCDGLRALIRDLHSYHINDDTDVTINLADGTYNCSDIVRIESDEFSQVSIIGNQTTPANVVLSFNGTTGVIIRNGSLRLLDGVRIVDATTSTPNVQGVMVTSNSTLRMGPNVEIADWAGAGSTCFQASSASVLSGQNWTVGTHPVLSNCRDGIRVVYSSTFVGSYIEVDGTYPGDTDGTGVKVSASSHLFSDGIDIQNFQTGVQNSLSGSVQLLNATVNNVDKGIQGLDGTHTVAINGTVTGCVTSCVEMNTSSSIQADGLDATCTAAAGYGFHILNGSYAYADNSSVTTCNGIGSVAGYNPGVNTSGNNNAFTADP